MSYLGDWTLGETFHFLFTTRKFSTGAPNVLTSGTVSAYENENLTQITSGVSLGADHDGVVGLNLVTVVATSGNGFEAGKSYSFVLTVGTVDSVSVVGEVVGYCTIQRNSSFTRLGAPAGASVSADVAAVKSDTAAILVDTGTTLDGRIPAALVSGRMDASVGAMAANVMTAAAAAADLSAEIADAVWDEDATAHQSAGTFGLAIGDPAASTETLYKAIVTDPAGTNIAADVIAIKAETALIVADTGTDGVVVNAAGLATDAVNEIADGILARTLGTESYATDGSVPTLAQMMFMLWSSLSEFSISGTTITAKKLDGSTTAMTFTLDSSTVPTSRTRAT